MAAMFQLVWDNIEEGQGAFFPSWKNEGSLEATNFDSTRAAAGLSSDSVNYEKLPPGAES